MGNKPNLVDLQKSISANEYPYYSTIKSPEELGIDESANNYDNNVNHLMSYLQLLFQGGGEASKVSGILGNKYFLPTGAKCVDTKTKKPVPRSIYINNVPDGDLINTFGPNATGLIPQNIRSINNIKPLSVFRSVVDGDNSACQLIGMPTIGTNNQSGSASQYVSVLDIQGMNPCWFPNRTNPITKVMCSQKQGFQNYNQGFDPDSNQDVATTIKYLYFISLAVVVYYIIIKGISKGDIPF